MLTLYAINIFMFYGLNWLFLISMIIGVYNVRHIKDRLEVRKEMTLIVCAWSFFSMWTFLWYMAEQLGSENCDQLPIN